MTDVISFDKALEKIGAEPCYLAMLPEHAVTSNPVRSKLKPLRITVPALGRDIAVIFRDRVTLDTSSRDLIRQIETVGADLSRERPQA